MNGIVNTVQNDVQVSTIAPRSATVASKAVYDVVDAIASKKSFSTVGSIVLGVFMSSYPDLQKLPLDVTTRPWACAQVAAVFGLAAIARLRGDQPELPQVSL